MSDHLDIFKTKTIFLDLKAIDTTKAGHAIPDDNLKAPFSDELFFDIHEAKQNEQDDQNVQANDDTQDGQNIQANHHAPDYVNDFGDPFIKLLISRSYFVKMIHTNHNMTIIQYRKGRSLV